MSVDPGLAGWLHQVPNVRFLHGVTVTVREGGYTLVVPKPEFIDRSDPRIAYDLTLKDAANRFPQALARRIIAVGSR